MKPSLICIILFLSNLSYGQQQILFKELNMGYGGFSNHNAIQFQFQDVDGIAGTNLSEEQFAQHTWYALSPRINAFKFGGALAIKQSEDFRKELLIGVNMTGQFQHRTFFSGRVESLKEETVMDVKTERYRRTYDFKTRYISEIKDVFFVNPNVQGRMYLSQRLGVKLTASVGVGAPFRNGIQISSYTGEIIREVENNEVISEEINGSGEVDIQWHTLPFSLALKSQLSASLELKPFELKPLFVSLGYAFGAQYHPSEEARFTYSGFEVGLISRF